MCAFKKPTWREAGRCSFDTHKNIIYRDSNLADDMYHNISPLLRPQHAKSTTGSCWKRTETSQYEWGTIFYISECEETLQTLWHTNQMLKLVSVRWVNVLCHMAYGNQLASVIVHLILTFLRIFNKNVIHNSPSAGKTCGHIYVYVCLGYPHTLRAHLAALQPITALQCSMPPLVYSHEIIQSLSPGHVY